MNLSEPSPSSDYPLSEHSDSERLLGDAAFHKQIKNVIFDVAIPAGLKDSVLASLSQNGISTLEKTPSVVRSRTRLLRNPRVIAGLSACLMFAMLLTYFWSAQGPVIALTELNPELNLDSRLLADFDNNFSARLPGERGWHLKDRLTLLSNKYYGVSVSQSSAHDAAVGYFKLRMGNAQPVFVALLQVPANHVEPLPSHTAFDPGNVAYTQLKKGNYATVKWVEDDRVYICIVFGGARELEALGRALQSASA
ncbi:MAG: hypothetical protein ABIK07_02825 [Planctomycetota bacterium]